MGWIRKLFLFEGKAKRSEFLRKLALGALLLWIAALIDEQLIRPYLCSQDPLKIGCIPGEVREQFTIEDNIALLIMFVPVVLMLLSVMIRRLNDHGKSGWWLLAGLTGIGLLPLLYWFLMRAPKAET